MGQWIALLILGAMSSLTVLAVEPEGRQRPSDTATGEDFTGTDNRPSPDPYVPPPNPASTSVQNGASSTSLPGPLKVACLGASGEVLNANPKDVCKAVLPECAKLKESIVSKAKDMLTQKIWCYYNGKDCDLSKSTPTNMIGTDLPFPICSVVGQQLASVGTRADAEIKSQAIGRRTSCGERPAIDAKLRNRKFGLKYEGPSGSLWNSYILGAYPWAIRSVAADVLTPIKSDLSNVDELLVQTKSISQDLASLSSKMAEFQKGLSQQSRAVCDSNEKDLISRCLAGQVTVTDPAQRLCTMVKASLAGYEGALPNLIVAEIMSRAQRRHDEVFSKVLTFENKSAEQLKDRCENTSGFLRSRRKKLSMTASCLFGGEFCTSGDAKVVEKEKDPKGNCETHESWIEISTGEPIFIRKTDGSSSFGKGFAGLIEKLIRNDLCGQKNARDASKCDSIGIPSKP